MSSILVGRTQNIFKPFFDGMAFLFTNRAPNKKKSFFLVTEKGLFVKLAFELLIDA
ncbi:MAG: hypothetical protein HGB11_13210 [Chlorobiales bacterium]|nr:hypothetical protein [Chlorobiales bacterium]